MLACLIAFHFLFARMAVAQVPATGFKFTTYTAKQGLAGNYVNDCVKDKKGFLWIATQNGLSRFDGVQFKNFFHDERDSSSLPFDLILRVYCDYRNRIWLAGHDGIAYYDQVSGRFHTLNLLKRDSRVPRNNAIAIDNENKKIWFASNGYLNSCRLENFSIETTTLAVENSESLNIYQYGGTVWLYDANMGYIYRYQIATATGNIINKSRRGRSLITDKLGNIWMGCYMEGITNGNDTSRRQYFSTNAENDKLAHSVRDLEIGPAFTGDSIIWVATSEAGIRFFNVIKKSFELYALTYSIFDKSGLPDNHVNNIYNDPDSIVWICTTAGIAKLNKHEQQFITRAIPFLQVNTPTLVTGIASNKKNNHWWLVTFGSGLINYDPATNEVVDWTYRHLKEPVDSPQHLFNRQTTIDASGNCWVASDNGLIQIDSNGKLKSIPLTIDGKIVPLTSIYADGDSVIWCGSIYHGLVKFQVATHQYSHFQKIQNTGLLIKNSSYKITEDKLGCLWMASKDGLIQFDKRKQELNRFENKNPNSNNNNNNIINSVCADDAGMLWLATIGGVVHFNPATKIFTPLKGESIPQGLCTSIRKDSNGFIWVYAAAGFFRIDPASKKSIRYNETDGVNVINDDEANPIMDFPGGKWALGYRGYFTVFDPLMPGPDKKAIPVVISEVQLFNQPLHDDIDSFSHDTWQLNYKENEISFFYSGIGYTNSDKIIFAHKLEGYDKDWVIAGRSRVASYTNLNTGNYVFKVKAANSYGLWNDTSTNFYFSIQPPFWKTGWFTILVVLAAGYLLWVFFKTKERRRAAEQLLRDKIARDLHDDVGSTLSGIHLFSKMALQKIGNDTIASGHLMEKVVERSDSMVNAMSDIVWSVNPANDSLDKIIIRMRSYALDMLEEQDIEVQFDTPSSLNRIKLKLQLRKDFYLIYKEAINNIAKYAAATKVNITILLQQHTLLMEISDNGKGFDAGQATAGNGLKNMKARANAVGATLAIVSAIGKGTIIKLAMPL